MTGEIMRTRIVVDMDVSVKRAVGRHGVGGGPDGWETNSAVRHLITENWKERMAELIRDIEKEEETYPLSQRLIPQVHMLVVKTAYVEGDKVQEVEDAPELLAQVPVLRDEYPHFHACVCPYCQAKEIKPTGQPDGCWMCPMCNAKINEEQLWAQVNDEPPKAKAVPREEMPAEVPIAEPVGSPVQMAPAAEGPESD